MKTYTHAYIYLIREREFLLRNEPVFKIGRGAQDADRIIKRVATGYKKGSEIWLTIRCPISTYKEVETSLKSTFRQRFQTHGDGSEYFEGDPTEMTQLISDTVNKSWSTNITVDTEDNPDRSNHTDVTASTLSKNNLTEPHFAARMQLLNEATDYYVGKVVTPENLPLSVRRLTELSADKITLLTEYCDMLQQTREQSKEKQIIQELVEHQHKQAELLEKMAALQS